MYLYYTTPTAPEVEQIKVQNSLGGFKSSSRVQSGRFDNMFSDISQMTVSNFNQNQYIGLVLKNELGVDKTNLKLWFDFPVDAYSFFRVAAVDMALDSSGNLQMEHVSSLSSKPINATFYEASGVANAVDLGNLADGAQIGIWIERELNIDFIKTDSEDIYEPDTTRPDRYKAKVKNKLDEVMVNISWD